MLPPIVEQRWLAGSGPNSKPCGASASASARFTTPGSTSAALDSVSISRMRRSRAVETTTPPGAIAPPASPVPAPRATSGTSARAHAATTAAVSAAVPGAATSAGVARSNPASYSYTNRSVGSSRRCLRPTMAASSCASLRVLVDPDRSVVGVLLLPDRHDLLEPVDREPAGGEGFSAVRRRDRDHDGVVPDRECADAVVHGDAQRSPTGLRLRDDLADLRLGHLRIGLVLQQCHTLAAVLAPHR